jgi:tRNA(Glu) U13 pseudouridine synthase TruD
MLEPVEDELTYDITIKFTLPKGSYATMVLKKLFGK